MNQKKKLFLIQNRLQRRSMLRKKFNKVISRLLLLKLNCTLTDEQKQNEKYVEGMLNMCNMLSLLILYIPTYLDIQLPM